ncbi:putative TetR-family regulatory protein [Streptomyces sulfonofaciens]|uniref:TetR-family regulatory protein n=1 Tax=Streptomyces sulfonofaciens TaxID=68272 RepID=A0A919FSJ2_9ACTN|nr:TetR/AcrR family transcriptional regulator [Streptomyces sulfonofaciens]GHH71616.1 putative TetR-family regulatory protein [Streptomyces sulfonofaciens]
MPKGVTKRRPRTRAALLGAALEVFAEQGFHAATIEQICERANYSRGAFYSNFRTKEELFFALFDEHIDRSAERMAAIVEQVTADGEPSVDALAQALSRSRLEPSERAWYLVTTEFTLHAIRTPEAARKLAEHDARARTLLARHIEDLVRRLGRELTVDAEDFARLLVAIREGGLAQSYVEPDRLPPGELDRRFTAPLLAAVTRDASNAR